MKYVRNNTVFTINGYCGKESMIVLVLLLLGICLCIYIDKKQRDKRKLADIEWLNNEKLKPKYVVVFKPKGLSSLEALPYTDPFEPDNSVAGNPWNIRYTSKSLAEIHLKNSYERGYFTDREGITYPSCNIVSAWIAEYKTNLVPSPLTEEEVKELIANDEDLQNETK